MLGVVPPGMGAHPFSGAPPTYTVRQKIVDGPCSSRQGRAPLCPALREGLLKDDRGAEDKNKKCNTEVGQAFMALAPTGHPEEAGALPH